MNPLQLSVVALIVAAAGVLPWYVASRRYRRRMAVAQARGEKHRQHAAENLDRVKRQLGQVQEDLSQARQEIKRLSRERPKAAAAPAAAQPSTEQTRQDLLQMLATAPAARLPAHGFADTLPSRQFEEGLLVR